ncbi:hypothetical protein WOLCODRAFT_139085 [Wolfiporia cocos MD-104 SS10]|uniref:Uncharacterized protein n=1 Tax=Wolfiporia cocos (strain MD-104) TaxID=742152 RepID=A0A2H3JQZ8_WOLCO|nr:hypothetical protein WOLCODRAFT_139085 [Wolfiporia cocos MD-104 SS10]
MTMMAASSSAFVVLQRSRYARESGSHSHTWPLPRYTFCPSQPRVPDGGRTCSYSRYGRRRPLTPLDLRVVQPASSWR